MNYDDFVCYVQRKVQKFLGEEVRVELHQITKNNSVRLDGLSIIDITKCISPTIYLNDYFDEYQSGMSIPDIIEDILKVYEKNKIKVPLNTDFYTDYNNVKSRVACKVINFEKNRELLKKIPYVKYLDLAVVFYYFLKNESIGTGTILIYNSHLKMWNITKEELYDSARKNTPSMLPFEFKCMDEIMEDMDVSEMEDELADIFEEKECRPLIPMYVLSNKEKTMGAACILYDSILTLIGERLQSDFYILPSSIHECIIIPKDVLTSKDGLQEMVKEVNETQVKPEEILSDKVYFYNRIIHHLSLC